MLGDISLAGYPIHANIIAYRPGHKTNVEFAKKIKAYVRKNNKMLGVPRYDPSQPAIYDVTSATFGYDTTSLDAVNYDPTPSREIRIIFIPTRS